MFAPEEACHCKVGAVSHVVPPFAGEEREGAAGADWIVTFQTPDHEPLPQELEADTRQ